MKAAPYYNHGRWVVGCPAADCRAAIQTRLGVFGEHCDCRDQMVCDHLQQPCRQPIEMVWHRDAAEIQRLCDLRPHRINRNWWTDETLIDLEVENALHEVGI